MTLTRRFSIVAFSTAATVAAAETPNPAKGARITLIAPARYEIPGLFRITPSRVRVGRGVTLGDVPGLWVFVRDGRPVAMVQPGAALTCLVLDSNAATIECDIESPEPTGEGNQTRYTILRESVDPARFHAAPIGASPDARRPRHEYVEDVDERDKLQYWPTAALRASSPLGISASLNVIRARGLGEAQFCRYEPAGLSGQVEAGTGGAQVSIGIAAACSERRWIHFTPGGFATAVALRATYLRTWGQPWGDAEPGRHHVGIYAEAGPPLASARLGILKPVGVPAGGRTKPILYFGGAFGF